MYALTPIVSWPVSQGMEGKFDMVVCLLGTLSHMVDNRQAAAAFKQAARHLRPGGLLLLELAHPGRDSTPLQHTLAKAHCLTRDVGAIDQSQDPYQAHHT